MRYLLLLTILFSANYTLAEEDPARGRTEDGRAYRTDESGFQVVDYLAELEMQVEEQKRQILALQNELTAAAKPKVQEPLAEKNLLTGETRKISAADNSAEFLQLKTQLQNLNSSIVKKDQQIAELNSRLNTLQSDSNLQEAELENARALLVQAKQLKQSEVLNGSAELGNAQNKLQAQSAEIQRLQAELSKIQSSNQDLIASSQQGQDQELSWKSKLANCDQLIQSQKIEIATLKSELSNTQPVPAQTLALVSKPPSQKVSFNNNASVPEASRSKAFNILADNIRKDIDSANVLEKERQSFFKTYKANPKSGTLAFNLTPAKNSEGVSLESLPGLLNKSASFADLSKVQKALLYISKSIKSDVELLRRLVK